MALASAAPVDPVVVATEAPGAGVEEVVDAGAEK